MQLEWTALSMRTGNDIYAEKSQKIFHAFHDVYPDQVTRLLQGPSILARGGAPLVTREMALVPDGT